MNTSFILQNTQGVAAKGHAESYVHKYKLFITVQGNRKMISYKTQVGAAKDHGESYIHKYREIHHSIGE